MTDKRSRVDLDSYLAMLTGNGRARGWLEVRYRTRTGMRTRFYSARRHRRSSLEKLLANVSRHRDVYIGCAMRGIQRGDRASLAGAWVLWAELDTPDADQALEAFATPPSMVIASGIIRSGCVQLRCAWADRRRRHVFSDTARILRPSTSGEPR